MAVVMVGCVGGYSDGVMRWWLWRWSDVLVAIVME